MMSFSRRFAVVLLALAAGPSAALEKGAPSLAEIRQAEQRLADLGFWTSGWKTSPLGKMHNPLYIVGGIAIHGSEDMRTYPASHGCIRIPMFASHLLPKLVPKGTPVYVYGCQEERPAGSASAAVAAQP